MSSEQAFREAAAGEVSLDSLEREPAVIYALDGDLRIVYCNRAWDDFAQANKGHGMLREIVIGRPLLDFIVGPLQPFYASAYEKARATGSEWQHTYECSSPGLMRQFRMQVLPLRNSPSLLVVNSLVVERPHDQAAAHPLPELYRDANGLIAMCSHCRRTRRAASPAFWDWVPSYVASIPPRVSHSLCRTCEMYHYPDFARA